MLTFNATRYRYEPIRSLVGSIDSNLFYLFFYLNHKFEIEIIELQLRSHFHFHRRHIHNRESNQVGIQHSLDKEPMGSPALYVITMNISMELLAFHTHYAYLFYYFQQPT